VSLTRIGLPTTVELAGTSLFTTAPAPIVMQPIKTALAPTNTLFQL